MKNLIGFYKDFGKAANQVLNKKRYVSNINFFKNIILI